MTSVKRGVAASVIVLLAGTQVESSARVRSADATAPGGVESTNASAVVGPAGQPALGASGKRFWVRDKHFYRSGWYAGRHRKMIAFGCTRAPYYPPAPNCPRQQGFHHGLDIAMQCGTRLFAGLRGTVVRPGAPGSLGSAYGPYAFRLRNQRLDLDFVIGHVKRVYVEPGDHVAKGELIARASDQGAPDGCHLHFEARPKGGSYDDAVKPNRYLDLRPAGRAGRG